MSDTFDHAGDAVDQALAMGDIVITDLYEDGLGLLDPAQFMAKKASRGELGMRAYCESFRGPELKHDQRRQIPKSTTTRQEVLMRTMYDNHKDASGNAAPIFMLGNQHLKSIIHYKVNRFVKQRNQTTAAPTVSDPMIAAMGTRQAWTAKELMGRTTALLEELNPYLQEALVRGGTVAAEASTAMQNLAGRENAMSAKSDLQEAVQARLDKNPMDSRAMFARISFEEELEAGMNESLAAHKWLERLRA